MATADQIKALISSHTQGDNERFISIALQIAAQEAMQGHGKLAIEIRQMIERVRNTIAHQPLGRVEPLVHGELSNLLSVGNSKVRLNHMVLPDDVRARLERVILEQKQQHKIREFGLHPRSKLLLVGPPGSGKTMTAFALAGEMQLPIFTIQLDNLLTKYLGETASKLRTIFDTIHRVRGIYFFDEFDAIGGRRNATNDVGEIRRVLNSFLQFIERNHSESLIIAATNHAEILDRALFRRFDDLIEYGFPTEELAEKELRSRLANSKTDQIDWASAVRASKDLSFADIAKACDDAVKTAVLNSSEFVRNDDLLRALGERKKL